MLMVVVGVVVAITALPFSSKGQADSTINSLKINQFDLISRKAKASSTNTILLDATSFLQKFGIPVKTTTEYSEVDDTIITHYSYNGADVWYMNNRLEAMNITSPNYVFQLLKGRTIKVGDNISVVANLFHGSYTNRQFTNQVFIQLEDQIGPVDMLLIFQFDLHTYQVTEITVQ